MPDEFTPVPEHITEIVPLTSQIQHSYDSSYNIGRVIIICIMVLIFSLLWFYLRKREPVSAVECFDYSGSQKYKDGQKYNCLTLVVTATDLLSVLQICQQATEILRQQGQQLAWLPGVNRLDGMQEDYLAWALHTMCPEDGYNSMGLKNLCPENGYFFRPRGLQSSEKKQRLCIQLRYREDADIQVISGLAESALRQIKNEYCAGGHVYRGEGYTWNICED